MVIEHAWSNLEWTELESLRAPEEIALRHLKPEELT